MPVSVDIVLKSADFTLKYAYFALKYAYFNTQLSSPLSEEVGGGHGRGRDKTDEEDLTPSRGVEP
jgi:hypothetical protein